MVDKRTVVVCVLALVGALASGCISDDGVKPAEDDGPTIAPDAVVTEATGSIKGQVITLDLEPVVRQAVELFQMGNGTALQTTKTDLQGRFTFNGLATGDYQVKVAPPCCHERIEGVAVHAGAVSQVAYMLERIVVYTPFVEENEWSGFIACTVGSIGACNADPKDERDVYFDVAWGLHTMLVAVTWQPAGGVSSESLRLVTERGQRPGNGYDYGVATGENPLRLTIDDTVIGNEEYQFANISAEDGLRVRHIVSGNGVGFVYQQAFTIFWNEYYHGPAPEDADPIPPDRRATG